MLAEAEGYHMIVGERAKGSKRRFHRNAANICYNFLASYVTRFKVKDLASGFHEECGQSQQVLPRVQPRDQARDATPRDSAQREAMGAVRQPDDRVARLWARKLTSSRSG